MKSKITMIIMIMGLALGGFGSAFGGSSYMTPFNNANGTAYNCGVCHTTSTATTSSARVQFGADWASLRGQPINYNVSSNPALANLDSDGDGFSNSTEILARTNPGDSTSRPTTTADTIAPTVNSFTIPTSSASLVVPITAFTATDNLGVTGYLVNESATKPAAGNWPATAPMSYTFAGAGAKTLYAWARDAAGNVSNALSSGRSVTITLADTTLPVVSAFTIPSSSTSLVVPITAIVATDNVGVMGYLVNESATKPAAGNWPTAAPTSYTFASAGTKTLYAWARDLAGNVSNSLSGTVTIDPGGSGVDVESPEVMEFTLPLTSTSPTVPILAFRAIDNVEATEHLITYLITTTPAAPAANSSGWSATPPASYTFSSGGAKTLYGWAKDAAGNISESVWDNVDLIAATDQTPPVVTSFSIPSTSRTFTVSIRQFTATDNTGVTGYLVTTGLTKPGSANPNWRSTPPTKFTFTSTGRKRLYAWAKDAAGNVSSASRKTVMVLGDNPEQEEEDD